ncbi:daptide-type RiPP [Streptomyces sp. NPDC048566]|uniref:daptide-type RiPP n=1 Tax=Streptomyces sp. NPDC048566 TaxID=3365569 RepID=UPI003713216F
MQDNVVVDTFPALELGMQELEAMEAPGWWTAVGVSAGVVVASAAGYGSYVASAAVIAT